MIEYLRNPAPFPAAMGSEEELGLIFNISHFKPVIGDDGKPKVIDGNIVFAYGEPEFAHISDLHNIFLGDPIEDRQILGSSSGFWNNGMRVYFDHSSTGDQRAENLEFATPESQDPRELTARIFAAEDVIVRYIAKYIEYHNEVLVGTDPIFYPKVNYARIQRRAIDKDGRTQGMHDNFDLSRIDFGEDGADFLHDLMLAHSLTRPFITGSGLVIDGSFEYSAKLRDLEAVFMRKPHERSIYSIKDYGARMELRSGEPNLRQWPTWQRVGQTAMLLAMMATPLRAELRDIISQLHVCGNGAPRPSASNFDNYMANVNELAQGFNALSGPQTRVAAEMQLEFAKLALDKLQLYVEPHNQPTIWGLPNDYYRLAQGWHDYAVDYISFLDGKKTLEDLVDRPDWARKLMDIQEDADKRGASSDAPVSDYDVHAQRVDMTEDLIGLRVQTPGNIAKFGEKPRGIIKVEGPGIKNRGVEDDPIVLPAEIGIAKNRPPENRAQLRTNMIETIIELDDTVMYNDNWNYIIVAPFPEDTRVVTINLPSDVMDIELSEKEQVKYEALLAQLRLPSDKRSFDELVEFIDWEMSDVSAHRVEMAMEAEVAAMIHEMLDAWRASRDDDAPAVGGQNPYPVEITDAIGEIVDSVQAEISDDDVDLIIEQWEDDQREGGGSGSMIQVEIFGQ